MTRVNQTISHYKILAQLGAGGMGEVYLAEDIRLHRKVALKVLPAAVASNQDRMRQTAKRSSPPTRAAEPNCGS
jgi:serine/threonine protein kinase